MDFLCYKNTKGHTAKVHLEYHHGKCKVTMRQGGTDDKDLKYEGLVIWPKSKDLGLYTLSPYNQAYMDMYENMKKDSSHIEYMLMKNMAYVAGMEEMEPYLRLSLVREIVNSLSAKVPGRIYAHLQKQIDEQWKAFPQNYNWLVAPIEDSSSRRILAKFLKKLGDDATFYEELIRYSKERKIEFTGYLYPSKKGWEFVPFAAFRDKEYLELWTLSSGNQPMYAGFIVNGQLNLLNPAALAGYQIVLSPGDRDSSIDKNKYFIKKYNGNIIWPEDWPMLQDGEK